MRPFQVALIAGFSVIAVLALVIFSTYKGGGDAEENLLAGGITIWGTLPDAAFTETIYGVTKTDTRFQAVTYVRKDAATIDRELLEAIADGTPPDLLVISNETLYSFMPRLYAIPYTSFPQRTFKDTYIDGAEVFMRSDGVYGIPFAVDPLVLYWNRDLFATANLTLPPTTYEDLLRTYVDRLRVAKGTDIAQAAIAFGEHVNIAAAKQLFALFAIQAGSDMVREENGQYRVTFADQETTSQTIPGVAAAQFFTDFANPQSVYYTWNRTLPDDVSLFSASRLAMRIGFASDYAALRARNPNLNFDVAPIPQNASANVKRGYGTYYAFAVPRNAKNAAGSLFVAQTLAAAGAIEQMTSLLGMAPAHRSVLATLPADPVESVRYSAAIIARTWLDPKPAETNVVVREMFESIIAGRAQAGSAVTNAMQRIRNLF
ncbi:hypothetical protein A3C89_01535 [Candidatus Kaiserbacteria bacterium RIFCSPHIGHO2_02_FULL_50_50]|uniref:ABC transporter substrate-binding protein n=1 Tax=Candidatus Kaiserbacteria bacterium RIFCSPHIGHO2_02_FULL_50_50 TaxID=1798492 RepID=A0A1F6DDG3_9BACT|nr:MAG: hypothetical protein A3C89_01535 [Candidatus Kaiserbacteria bacterium RIFCSPHIGHO2_02_FULL_50_50]